jgi:hypothetical protein
MPIVAYGGGLGLYLGLPWAIAYNKVVGRSHFGCGPPSLRSHDARNGDSENLEVGVKQREKKERKEKNRSVVG